MPGLIIISFTLSAIISTYTHQKNVRVISHFCFAQSISNVSMIQPFSFLLRSVFMPPSRVIQQKQKNSSLSPPQL